MESQEHVVTTSSGYKVKVIGIPQTLIDTIQASKKYPPVPTYLAPTVTDPAARLPHEHFTSIEEVFNPDTEKHEKKEVLHSTLTTDEDKKVWAEYKAACAAEDARVATNIFKAVLLTGIEAMGQPPEGWEAMQKYLGITLPEDPLDKKLYWLNTEVMRNKVDIDLVMTELLRTTGVSEEQLGKVMGSFRNPMEGETSTAGVDHPAAEGTLVK
jgi:hypothetical protein